MLSQTEPDKVLKTLVQQSYSYGFFPESDFTNLKSSAEKKWGREKANDLITFKNKWGINEKP